ncbi:FtsX-like permease family protein, partial [Erysipelotrichaceae bacterium OttesenSCG-928-M19]|nr:FtsX-like permease family protein [Erysipelotrichaceae bacterium OttesenSCG-928-M19]
YTGEVGYGRLPKNSNPYEVMVSLSTAQDLISDNEKVADLLNKKVYISITNMETEKNKIAEATIVGITSDNTLFSATYITDDTYRVLVKDLFDIKIEDTKTRIVQLVVNDENVKEYVKELNDSQDEYTYETTSDSILGTVNTILDVVRNGLVAFSSISVVVAILMIAIVVYISVLERKQEIGIIRAIGGKTKDIRNMFLGESLVIGLLSGLIGTTIAYGICYGINQLIWSALQTMNENIPYVNVANLEPTTALILIAICGVLSVISGLVPSLKAAKLDPIDAIRKK